MPTITALRERARGPSSSVEIELDGTPWRLVPTDAVVRAGLAVGRALDREAARTLGRELRRVEALTAAARVLRHRDVSRRRLDERLERRGVRADARRDALTALERAGLVDDGRVAEGRARSLAGRGYGDAAIRDALEDEGVAEEHAAAALAALEPERERAARLLVGRAGDGKVLRRLAAKGFAAETLADLTPFADDD